MFVDGAAEEAGEPEEDYGADDRCDQAADDAAGVDAEETEEPAAQDAADYADHEINYESKASAAHQFAGYESGENADKYV